MTYVPSAAVVALPFEPLPIADTSTPAIGRNDPSRTLPEIEVVNSAAWIPVVAVPRTIDSGVACAASIELGYQFGL